jgi:hypothetical protein
VYDREAKRAADQAYQIQDGGLLPKVNKDYDPNGKTGRYGQWGFSATLSYSEKTKTHYLAFPGTRSIFSDPKGAILDWTANVMQAAGFRTSQMDQAIKLTTEVQVALGPDAKLVLPGHSKAGAQSTAASFATGAPAIVFNPSSLSSVYRQGTPGEIRSHVTIGDPLSLLRTIGANPEQPMSPSNRAPAGVIIVHPPRSLNPFEWHSLPNFPD